ncbi:MAG: T9SS type A sorting domain-containing protein [Pseudobacter sp.]|uniref:T9SS type A sorting domain-containing protein n=1 Tax=Pseudobacter sp. TaxID=2045420 RepID=UPI003F7FDE8D
MKNILASLSLLLIHGSTPAQQIKVYAGGQMILSPGSPVTWSGLTLIPSTAFNMSSSLDQSTTTVNAFPSSYVLRVFRFDPTSTVFNGSIGFHYLTGELNGLDNNNLELYVNNGISWQGYPPSVATPALNYLQVDGISNLAMSEVLLAASSALPLTWVTASLHRQGTGIKIKWSTSQEKDVSHFDIERSTDAAAWRIVIAGIPASNSTFETKYEATDRNASTGRLFYRIRQTDKDGGHTFSKILVAPAADEQTAVVIAPNPASGFFLATTDDISSLQQLYLINQSGVVMHSWKGGQYQYQLPPVAAGSYFLLIRMKDGSSMMKKIQIR